VYNQFRIKDIPKDEIHRDEIEEMVGEVFRFLGRDHEVMHIKTRIHSLGPTVEWDLRIEERGEVIDIVLENTKSDFGPYRNMFFDARTLMKQLHGKIDKAIHERKRAINVERQALEAKRKAREERKGEGARG